MHELQKKEEKRIKKINDKNNKPIVESHQTMYYRLNSSSVSIHNTHPHSHMCSVAGKKRKIHFDFSSCFFSSSPSDDNYHVCNVEQTMIELKTDWFKLYGIIDTVKQQIDNNDVGTEHRIDGICTFTRLQQEFFTRNSLLSLLEVQLQLHDSSERSEYLFNLPSLCLCVCLEMLTNHSKLR